MDPERPVQAPEGAGRRFQETWSPAPVLGYRVWFVLAGVFYGAWERWESPSLRARCLTTLTNDGVPHTDGRCGPSPCGIHAVKNVSRLLEPVNLDLEPPDLVAVGLVGLSGKVVEHRHGYRGAHATVLALALARGPVVPLFTNAPDEIHALFEDPALCWSLRADPDVRVFRPVRQAIVDYLEALETSHTWTSEIENG